MDLHLQSFESSADEKQLSVSVRSRHTINVCRLFALTHVAMYDAGFMANPGAFRALNPAFEGLTAFQKLLPPFPRNAPREAAVAGAAEGSLQKYYYDETSKTEVSELLGKRKSTALEMLADKFESAAIEDAYLYGQQVADILTLQTPLDDAAVAARPEGRMVSDISPRMSGHARPGAELPAPGWSLRMKIVSDPPPKIKLSEPARLESCSSVYKYNACLHSLAVQQGLSDEVIGVLLAIANLAMADASMLHLLPEQDARMPSAIVEDAMFGSIVFSVMKRMLDALGEAPKASYSFEDHYWLKQSRRKQQASLEDALRQNPIARTEPGPQALADESMGHLLGLEIVDNMARDPFGPAQAIAKPNHNHPNLLQ